MPLVLVRAVASRQLIVAASERAKAHGIRTDMTLAEARALCPDLIDAPHEPEKDLHALEGLARWMTRFTPMIAIESGNPPALFLDIAGCTRAFGGLPTLLEQITESTRRLRLHAKIAVAPTPGAAWALAYAAPNGSAVVNDDQIRPAITPLPVASLRINDDARATLHHLGIETVGQLLNLPRHALPARFGSTLLTRIDQALGRIPEPLTALPYSPPIESRLDFDGVIDSLESIWLAFRQLIEEIVPHLARRGQGARKLELHFFRSYAPTITKTILLSRPSRDPKNLFNLMRCAMETLESVGAGHAPPSSRKRTRSRLAHKSTEEGNAPAGFTGLKLCVPVFEQLTEGQVHLLEREDHDAQIELDHLLERLMLRLGEEAVVRPQLTESYIPERAWHPVGSASADRLFELPSTTTIPPRPLHLLDTPIEIPVMVSPSHDRDGRPISFTFEGVHHRVTHSIGPERIAGQWWQGHSKTRDYFAIETETALRLWLFRVHETSKWYVHGKFE